MPAALEFAVYSLAAPAAVALAVAVLLQRLLPQALGERFGLALALAAGFFAGYWLLPPWASLLPQRHWQWLPYVALAAAFAGWTSGPSASPGRTGGPLDFPRRTGGPSYVAWILWVGLPLVSAWLLVPTWATLWPPRLTAIPLLALYLVLEMGLLAALPERLTGRLLVSLMTACAIAVALSIAIGVSLKLAQVAALAAAALTGCAAAGFVPRARLASGEPARAISSRGIIPIFAVLVGGLAFVGAIEPDPPLPIVLLAPAAPLVLWLFAAGPLAKVSGWKAAALQVAAVLLPLAIALAVVALSGADIWNAA